MLAGSVLNGERNAISACLEEECRDRQERGEAWKDRMAKSGTRKEEGEGKESRTGDIERRRRKGRK